VDWKLGVLFAAWQVLLTALAAPGAVGRTPVRMRDWRQRRLVRERERQRRDAVRRDPG
jgi:hypothetical protein